MKNLMDIVSAWLLLLEHIVCVSEYENAYKNENEYEHENEHEYENEYEYE